MEWIVLIIVAIVCLIVGALIGGRSAIDQAKEVVFRQEAGRAEDRAALLFTVSRELANSLMWENPDGFVSLYQSLNAETQAYKSWKPEALQQKYDEISKKYPQYSTFDVLGVRRYVLYPAACAMFEDGDLAQCFSDITRFVAILNATDEHWKRFKATDDAELKHLQEYVQRIKDTKFKLRLQRAIKDYDLWSSAKDELLGDFDNRSYSVRRVHHFAENRYGVHLKETNEYGLYGFFVHDDPKPNGDMRITYSYYRSDPSFQNEEYLNVEQSVFEYFGGTND